MKKLMMLFLLVTCSCVWSQQPVTDGNGDGVVDLQDFANLAGDWLGAGYAGLETNCRIDIGFYVGDSGQQDGTQQVSHYLQRIPNFIMIIPLSSTYNIVPAIIVLDGTETKFKAFNSRDCDVYTPGDVMAYNEDIFKVRNISSDEGHWLNKTDGRYMYIAVSQELPAMQMMSMIQSITPVAASMEAVETTIPTVEATTPAVEDAEDVADAEEERLTTFLQELDEWIAQLDDPEAILSLQEIREDTLQDLNK